MATQARRSCPGSVRSIGLLSLPPSLKISHLREVRQVRRSDCSKSYSKPGAELAWNPGCDSESRAPHSPHIHRMVAEERRCLPRELSSKGVFSTLLFQLPPPLARAPSSCLASEASLNHQGWKTALQVTHYKLPDAAFPRAHTGLYVPSGQGLVTWGPAQRTLFVPGASAQAWTAAKWLLVPTMRWLLGEVLGVPTHPGPSTTCEGRALEWQRRDGG